MRRDANLYAAKYKQCIISFNFYDAMIPRANSEPRKSMNEFIIHLYITCIPS